MKSHDNDELQEVLQDTIRSNPNFSRNTDKAFLVLLLYMVLNINGSTKRNKYIEFLSYCRIPRENCIKIYHHVKNHIQNHNIDEYDIAYNKDIKIEHIATKLSSIQFRHRDFMQQYQRKLQLLVSGFVESRDSRLVELNLLALCIKYLDELTQTLNVPDKKTMIKSPISALIYLFTDKHTDYFDGTLIHDGNDQKQCEWINAVYPNEKYAHLISFADGYIFIRLLFDSFHRDLKFLTNSMNVEHQQSPHHLCISLCEYFIISSIKSQQSEPKRWEFYYYFIRFLKNNKLKIYIEESNEKNRKGLGLQLSKQICSCYNLKSGPYCKIKKEINQWCYQTFSPTIYGYWSWYNRTIKKWIPFPKKLKKYFRKLNDSYSSNQIYVDMMWCRFRIIRSIKDFEEINVANGNDIDVIPISPIIPINESNNNNIFVLQKYGQKIILGFIRNLKLDHNENADCVAIYIANYLTYNNTQNGVTMKRKDPPKNPLSILCYLYHISHQIHSVILAMDLPQQRRALRSHNLISQIQLQFGIDTEIKVFLAMLLDEYYLDIKKLNQIKKQNQWTSHHICLSLFSHIIAHSVSNQKTENAQYHFFVLFCRYIQENNITMQKFVKLATSGSRIVQMICGFYGIKSTKYSSIKPIISKWCQNEIFD